MKEELPSFQYTFVDIVDSATMCGHKRGNKAGPFSV